MWTGGIGSPVTESFAVTTDNMGNSYITGNTNTTDFPVFSSGSAYTQPFGGGLGLGGDVFIVKFDEDGARLWATFDGGRHRFRNCDNC